MKIISKEFTHGGFIPEKFTCIGVNINPELELVDVPAEAKSLVLIMDDPDVPVVVREDRMFDHWVVSNINPDTKIIDEDSTPAGAKNGLNSAGDESYRGPCPPDTLHRYFFKLYALDTVLDLQSGAPKTDVENAMQGHIIGTAVLIGLYEKPDDEKTIIYI